MGKQQHFFGVDAPIQGHRHDVVRDGVSGEVTLALAVPVMLGQRGINQRRWYQTRKQAQAEVVRDTDVPPNDDALPAIYTPREGMDGQFTF